jgi:hypothetical protein
MKKIMVLTIVLVFATVAKGAISVLPDNMTLAPAQSSQVVGIGIQNDDGSISFIYLGQTDIAHRRTCAHSDTTQLFPDTMTIMGLMLVGLHVRHRKAL